MVAKSFIIKRLMKKMIPESIRFKMVLVRKWVRYTYRKFHLMIAVRGNAPLKIIVGAAETYQKGWLATNEQWLDITNEKDWYRYFKDEQIISHIVAEHVFEHLTLEEANRALESMFNRLMHDGRIRIAVPDGYNPDENYIRHVDIGGIGDDAGDHKQLLNADVLNLMMIERGFIPQLVEGYTKDGELVQRFWLAEDGFIRRSRQNKLNENWLFPDAATSLIVDGIKK